MLEFSKRKGESGDLIIYVQRCNDFILEKQTDLGSYEKKKLSQMTNIVQRKDLHNNKRLQEIEKCIKINM